METKLTVIKKRYYQILDKKSRYIAYRLKKGNEVTKVLLDYVQELYMSEKKLKSYYFNEKIFEYAYHQPITSDLEFLIARILFNYSKIKGLKWEIYLRKQENSIAPDIRIKKNSKVLAIIEIKAAVGFMRHVFNKEIYKKGLQKYKEHLSEKSPYESIVRLRKKLRSYAEESNVNINKIFMLIPTLKATHRKKSDLGINDYIEQFSKATKIPKRNLIILSENLTSGITKIKRNDYKQTTSFEDFIEIISKK
jgi:hypothetical protein